MKTNNLIQEQSKISKDNTFISVLEMTKKQAREFFLKETSYCNLQFPDYITFQPTLNIFKKALMTKQGKCKDIDTIIKEEVFLGDLEGLNYTIYINKDGKYSWRPITLVHPLPYIDLVNYLTGHTDDKEDHWNLLKQRFNDFRRNKKIQCFSIPGESKLKGTTDEGVTILNWWKQIEQQSISKSLEYTYCFFTDIADFYPSIYTHSLCWAIHGKKNTKKNLEKSKNWYGGQVDKKLQRLQNNQTNGIPQGSALMDFIAEIILGYLDLKLMERLEEKNIVEYSILRYRDDYRIFSNDKNELEEIAKSLQEVLQILNLKLNSSKTKFSENIILDSIKADKLYWEPKRFALRNSYLNKDKDKRATITIQKHLWQIKELADQFPNSGMLKKSLTELYEERIRFLDVVQEDLEVLVSILVNIMLENPNVIPHCTTIISKLYENVDNEIRLNTINKVLSKFKDKPNTEHVEIWLQRLLVLTSDSDEITSNTCRLFESRFTKHVANPGAFPINTIFPIDWIEETKIHFVSTQDLNSLELVDKDKLEEMMNQVLDDEINIFEAHYEDRVQ
ncbi:MAG: RNA-directed DNA polymerase [Bacillota bacterium]|nr:RNA-directed DNA polymerase [Bacillota bacterium]